jgi:endonuclease/exonuclease/phosphatase family metal-dependent hydrolase
MRVLTWNLFHGRSVPESRRALLPEFTDKIAGWEWDVALLQEVPPWWPPLLAQATTTEHRRVLTSRNTLAPVRRAIASRNPDLLGSWGGGSNAILARGVVLEHRTARLAWWPERRRVHGVRLENGAWVVNFHATTEPKERTRADVERVVTVSSAWAAGEPLVIGGDFNLRRPEVPGFAHVCGHHVDHVFARGFPGEGNCTVLDAGRLSDHRPLLARL